MENIIEAKSAHKFTYGLFVLTAKTSKDSGCIINTAIQVTSEPYQISIAVNKQNYTLEMILSSGEFNVSMLSEKVTFDVFTRFGFQSGRTINKFDGFNAPTSSNGIKYLDSLYANAYVSCKVENTIDLGTHVLVVGKVTEAKVLSSDNSCSYSYYLTKIKPQPKKVEAPKNGQIYACQLCGYEYDESAEKTPFNELPNDWACPLCGADKSTFRPSEPVKVATPTKAKVYVCNICGYEYDEAVEKVPFEELPDDWTCPLCKHPKSDFELKLY